MSISDIISFVTDFHAAVMASCVAPMLQEIAVICVCFSSALILRGFCHKPHLQKPKLQAKQDAFQTEPKPKPVVPPCRRTAIPDGGQLDPRQAERMASLEKAMMQLLEAKEFNRALQLFETHTCDNRDLCFSEDCYSAFVESAVRVGALGIANRIFRIMRRVGAKPSPKCWQTTLHMLSSCKNFAACLHIHSVFGREMPVDKVALSCLVNAALELGDLVRAAAILDEFGQTDLEPEDYVLFFRTYAALNDPDSSEAVFHRLGKVTSNLMLKLCVQTCVNSREPERALRLVREAHAFEQEGAVQIVDVVIYKTIIKGFARESNVQQCFECLREMGERGFEPDSFTFSTLLDLCVADSNLEIADKLVKLMLQNKKEVDTVVYSLFMRGLVRAKLLEHAVALYEGMKRRKWAFPDLITYSALIKALAHQHDLDQAVACFEDMRFAGLRPDAILYSHLLLSCRYANQHSRGQHLFNDMLERGVRPSESTLVAMLKLHGSCGFHQEAFDLVAGWEKQQGTKPSVMHFTCLMTGCLRAKNYERAWEAYKMMKECCVQPDSKCVSSLMPGLVAAQQWERVLELAEAARSRSSCMVPAETLNNALSKMASGGAPQRLVEGLRLCMMTAGVPVTRWCGVGGGAPAGGGHRGFATASTGTR